MKITVWGINYAPEVTGIAPYNIALCQFLKKQGHDVTMLTTFSYYPTWKKREEDKNKVFEEDWINEIRVWRCWHSVPKKASTLKRIWHELSFCLHSFYRALRLPKQDCIIVISPPLLLGAMAWLVKMFQGTPYTFHIQDLQPDAALSLGMLRNRWLAALLYRLEAFAYDHALFVSAISQGMLNILKTKGIEKQKLIFFPNGVDLISDIPKPEQSIRGNLNLSSQILIATYSGNMGQKQGLEILLEAAMELVGEPIHFILAGDGAMRTTLQKKAGMLDLHNITFLSIQPEDKYHQLLLASDICLITQQAGSSDFFLPSKLLKTLALGRPVLAVADAHSTLTQSLQEGNWGCSIAPGNASLLAEKLRELQQNQAILNEWAKNGPSYISQFTFDRVLPAYETHLIEALRRAF